MHVITGGLVHSVTSPHGEPRDIVIEGDTIADIVPRGAVRNANAEVIDASRRLINPGLINGHTHSHGGLSKGVGDLWELDLLLNAAPWIGGHRSHDDKHLAALITAVEMVEKGATACYDLFFEFPAPTIEGMEAVASAYAKVGLRAVIAPMVADLTFYQAVPGLIDALPDDARDRAAKLRMGGADTIIAALRRLAETWSHPRDRLRLGIAPTIPHHCTREFMIACRDVARSHDLPMQTHVSEAKYQSASTFKVFSMSTVEIMDACGLIGPWLSAAHAIWISDSDMELMAKKGVAVSHNAAANLRLGSGMAAARHYMNHGVAVGIGTDGSASSDNQNMFEAIRAAAFVSRVRGAPPAEWISTADAFTMGTGSRARDAGFHRQDRALLQGRPRAARPRSRQLRAAQQRDEPDRVHGERRRRRPRADRRQARGRGRPRHRHRPRGARRAGGRRGGAPRRAERRCPPLCRAARADRVELLSRPRR
jgi:5-methylthioadenosine/S-adenosylhomocysteine deaminase